MRYIGIWYGGASYVVSSWAEHAEVFSSLKHAISEFRNRYYNGFVMSTHVIWDENGKPTVGDTEGNRAPGVSLEEEIWLVPFKGANLDALQRDGYPDRIVKFGPRGGVIVEKV